jgi:general secretion pathway protein J
MTLIELLVAISVLAVLSVMGYKAFSALLISRERLLQVSAQWIELARLFRRVELDLDQLPSSEALDRSPGKSLRLEGGSGAQRLALTVYSPQLASGRDILIYQSGNPGLSWSSLRAAGQNFPLLGADYDIGWRLRLDDGRWVEHWPDADGGVPRLLELRVRQSGIGAVTRWWSLP